MPGKRPASASAGRVDTWWFKNGEEGGGKGERPGTARSRPAGSPQKGQLQHVYHTSPWEKQPKKLTPSALQASVDRLYGGNRRPTSAPPRPVGPPSTSGGPASPPIPEMRSRRPYSALPRSLALSQPRWKPKHTLKWDEEDEMVRRLARVEPPQKLPPKKATQLTHEWNSVAGRYEPKMVAWKEKTNEENTEYLRNFYYEQLKKMEKTRKKLYDKWLQPLTRNKKINPAEKETHNVAMERLYRGQSAFPRKGEA